MKAGDALFEVTPNDLPDARAPYLQVTEYKVERVTPTLLIVRTVRRDGCETRHKIQQRWSAKRVGRSVFMTAIAALEAYAELQEREAANRQREAERCAVCAQWARVQLAKRGIAEDVTRAGKETP